jgi:hypothetical protein
MPDPETINLLMKALGAAALAAVLALFAIAQPWRRSGAGRSALAWILAIGTGFYLGCWILGLVPHWPPSDCAGRLLLVVFPVALAVEGFAALPKIPVWLGIIVRLVVAAGTAPALLYKSRYITDFAGPNSREWSSLQTGVILASLAAALALVWMLMIWLARRAPVSAPVVLAGVCGGAGLTVMLSGYATGGQLGLPLAAALAGGAIVALAASSLRLSSAWVGPAVVGWFSLLVIGHFFGELTMLHAVLLFVAPLFGWLPELPYVRSLRPWIKGPLRIILVAALVAAIVLHARHVFEEASKPSPGSSEPSAKDYMDFGR